MSLLSAEDWSLEIAERSSGRPALSNVIGESEWESFNQWLCFSAEEIELNFVDVEYGGLKKIPTVVARSVGHRFEISLSPEVSRNPNRVMAEWEDLVMGSSRVCLYAAYLQPIADDVSLWTLSQMKTEKGYWVDKPN